MSFLESYKHLEKICSEMFRNDRGLSAYIDEMINNPNGSRYVNSWDEDLKKLKHYKWVRNQISHVPGCNESNMCDESDKKWLDDFYYRIMNQKDPLAMYRKASSQRKNTYHQKSTYTNIEFDKNIDTSNDINNYRPAERESNLGIILFGIFAIALFVWIFTR